MNYIMSQKRILLHMISTKIKSVIVSKDISAESVKTLNSFGIDVLFSFDNKNVLPALSKHTDMQIAKINENKFVCAPECYEYYSRLLCGSDIELLKGNTYLSCNYPADIAYNIVITDKYAIHNFRHTDDVIKSNIDSLKKIDVRQGYTSCTLCLISSKAAITSDVGIKNALVSNDFDVLCVNDEHILLPGFDHGFLGGASFMLNESTLAVNGDIETHSDSKLIIDFCLSYGVSVVSLSKGNIVDIGSVISLQ